jgi:hypothetical protein
MKRHGRKRPYTDIGVRRLPCTRCGKPATRQWQVCADGNLYRPICSRCDVFLNGLVLNTMHDPKFITKMRRYRNKVLGRTRAMGWAYLTIP